MERIESYEEFQKVLESYANEETRTIAANAIPCDRPITGVKVPLIRKTVKQIPKEKFEEFLKVEPVTIAEVLARGMIVSELPYEEMLKWFDSQISYIDNWATCDIFCTDLRKTIKDQRDEFFSVKVEPLLTSNNEFAVRVGLVMFKCSYVDSEYLDIIFRYIEKLSDREEYYIRMAIAWLLSECFIKYPSATTGYLVRSSLPKWTFNKTISKINDSYRVDQKTKEYLKRIRKIGK